MTTWITGTLGDDILVGDDPGAVTGLIGGGGAAPLSTFGAPGGTVVVVPGFTYNDILNGVGGNDDLFGGAGDNVLDGGDGIDTAVYNLLSYAVPGGTNAIWVNADLALGAATALWSFGLSSDTLINIENLVGSTGDDTLSGDDGANRIAGLGGDDIIMGKDGDDRLLGGGGDDDIGGGHGNDVIDGGPGDDKLHGSVGDDTFTWEAGDGVDDINGNDGFNILNVLSNGVDPETTYDGLEQTFTRHNNLDVFMLDDGTTGDLIIDGAVHDGVGVNWGFKNTVIDDADDVGEFNLSTGDDTFYGTENRDIVRGMDGNDEIKGNGGDDVLRGNGGDDELYAGDGDDRVLGGAGDDSLFGGAGDDILDGQGGIDHLQGGLGDDQYRFNMNQLNTDPFAASDTVYGYDGLADVFGDAVNTEDTLRIKVDAVDMDESLMLASADGQLSGGTGIYAVVDPNGDGGLGITGYIEITFGWDNDYSLMLSDFDTDNVIWV